MPRLVRHRKKVYRLPIVHKRVGTPFPGNISDAVVYNLEDQIGSSVTRLNTSGAVIDKEEMRSIRECLKRTKQFNEQYYPFGDSSLRTFSSKRYRYVGKEKDQESGLYYYGARYYAAWTCRFISVDPLAGEFPHQSPYVAMDDNPINKIDPDGQETIDPGDSIDPPNVNVGIGVNIGTHNTSVTFNASITQNFGNWNVSSGISATGYKNFANTGKDGVEFRGSIQGGFDDGFTSLNLGTNFFKGLGGMSEFNQQTGIVNIGVGKFSASYENDGYPFNLGGNKNGAPWLGDGADRYRTAAVRLGYEDFAAGFNLFTGSRTKYNPFDSDEMSKGTQPGNYGTTMPHGFVKEDNTPYRMGAAYIAYKGTQVGIDSDRFVRHPIQDRFAHDIHLKAFKKTVIDTRQPGFQTLSNTIKPYIQQNAVYGNKVPRFTLY